MKKRIISLALSIILLLSCCPLMAFATDNTTERYTVLVLDTSSTSTFIGSNGSEIYTADTAIEYVQRASSRFLDNISNASGDNYVAVVSYKEDATVVSDFTRDFTSLKKDINNISASSNTRSISSGLAAANDLLQNITNENATKNVVLFTTGMTNDGDYTYSGKYDDDTVGSSWRRTDTQVRLYAYANSAIEKAEVLKSNNVYVYTIGLFQTMEGMPEEGKDVVAFFKLTANDLATSDDYYYPVDDLDNLEFTFGEVADVITHDGAHEFKYAGTLSDVDTATCYYYDSYFKGNSSDYNPSLATMSLCLELTCWSTGDDSGWTDDPNADNPNFKYARDLLVGNIRDDDDTGLGFTDFDVSEDWATSPGRDTIGVVAARKTLDDGSNLIAVAIRGGGYTVEWAGNVTVGATGEHTGFDRAKDRVLTFLDSYIDNHEISGTTKIWIVGYSRAGAVANLTAGAINNGHVFPRIGTIDKENLFAYCFAVPMGTTQANAQNTKHQNIHNIINYNDLVPMVAPSAWGFTRFNSNNDVTLPNRAELGGEFNDALYNALDYYNQFKNSDGTYIVKETSSMFRIADVNWWRILPGGEPFIETENYDIPTRDLLQDSLDIVATDIFENRANYYNNWEVGVRDILALVNGESISGSFSNQLSAKDFLTRFFGEFSLETLWSIASPMVAINFDSYETRIEKCKDNLKNYVRGITDDSELWGTITFASDFIDSLTDLLWNILKVAVDDLFNGDATKISTVTSFIQGISGETIFRAHYPEITLAWLMSMDKNYTGREYDAANVGYRIVRINCPVDVYVYDESNQLIANVINSVSDNSNVFAYENINGEIVIVLPADREYFVKIVAREDCSVNYSIEEISSGSHNVAQILAYNSVEMLANEFIVSNIPSVQNGIGETGSEVPYNLIDAEGRAVDKTVASGDRKYTVCLSRNNMYGFVTGSGNFSYASYAQIIAYPTAGSSFEGWYSNDTLVSKDSVYRFQVLNDITLQAVFTEPTLQRVSVNSTNGGTVSNKATLLLASGSELQLEAKCDEGYSFIGWTNTSGVINDPSSLSTSFKVADADAIITAVFEPNSHSVSAQVDGSHGTAIVKIGNNIVTEAEQGANVIFTAEADAGYEFDYWEVVLGGVDLGADKVNNPIMVTMPATSLSLKAHFKAIVPGAYNVTFHANGHGTDPASQTVLSGKNVIKPADPVESGWIFGGWYKDSACSDTLKFDFDTPVTAALDLYAKWTEETKPPMPPSPESYTVNFNMNGHGEQVTAQTITTGNKVTKPADPTENGWVFKGWYMDAAFQKAFDFDVDISSDTTIYAKWVADSTTPTDPRSPNTGDNSHILLWLMIFAISGATLTGTAIYSKKRKKTN